MIVLFIYGLCKFGLSIFVDRYTHFQGSIWYTSLNENGARRCFKDLASSHQIGWTAKDQIKVMVNLDKFRMKFYRNGHKVSSRRIRLKWS